MSPSIAGPNNPITIARGVEPDALSKVGIELTQKLSKAREFLAPYGDKVSNLESLSADDKKALQEFVSINKDWLQTNMPEMNKADKYYVSPLVEAISKAKTYAEMNGGLPNATNITIHRLNPINLQWSTQPLSVNDNKKIKSETSTDSWGETATRISVPDGQLNRNLKIDVEAKALLEVNLFAINSKINISGSGVGGATRESEGGQNRITVWGAGNIVDGSAMTAGVLYESHSTGYNILSIGEQGVLNVPSHGNKFWGGKGDDVYKIRPGESIKDAGGNNRLELSGLSGWATDVDELAKQIADNYKSWKSDGKLVVELGSLSSYGANFSPSKPEDMERLNAALKKNGFIKPSNVEIFIPER